MSEDFVVRLRGLPWSASEHDVRHFLSDCNVLSVHFTLTREGRATGEAFVLLPNGDEVEQAVAKHREHMQNRYIEVLRARKEEMKFALQRSTSIRELNESKNYIVRLRGLPFGCTSDDITNFLTGLVIAPDGIIRPTDKTGRVTGEAFVKFTDKETTERALQKHMQEIGNRYIEVFRSTDEECYRAQYPFGGGPNDELFFQRPKLSKSGLPSLLDPIEPDYDYGMKPRRERSPLGGASFMPPAAYYTNKYGGSMIGCATGHLVHMRGLPFRCTATEIVEFFRPLKVLNVMVLFDPASGRAMGEADVEFCSHDDAVEAMKKDKQHINDRYIDLFLDSHNSYTAPDWSAKAGNGAAAPTSYAGDGTGYDQAAYAAATAASPYAGYDPAAAAAYHAAAAAAYASDVSYAQGYYGWVNQDAKP